MENVLSLHFQFLRNLSSVWQSCSQPNICSLRAPNSASVALTNYSRRFLLSVWTDDDQPLAVLTAAPTWLRMPMLIICLFLHFAVITVALHGWRSTNTRSVLTDDWVRRKRVSTVGHLDPKIRKNKKSKTLNSSQINWSSLIFFIGYLTSRGIVSYVLVLLLEANLSQVQSPNVTFQWKARGHGVISQCKQQAVCLILFLFFSLLFS